jgi:hypothetical protein
MFTNRISIALLSIIVSSAFQGVAASAGAVMHPVCQARNKRGPALESVAGDHAP